MIQGLIQRVRRLFCKHRNCEIIGIQAEGLRKGVIIVHLMCSDCGIVIPIFHDFTETEIPDFRNGALEERLIGEGWVTVVGDKICY